MTTDTTTAASATRQRILDAASREFAEHGFAGARVDEIARRADVNKALLYYHVGNKQTIYTAVLVRNFDRVIERLAASTTSEGPASAQLGRVVSDIAEHMRERPDHPRIMLREFAAAGQNLEPEVLDRIVRILSAVRALFARGAASGEFRTTDPVLSHVTLIGASLILSAVIPLRERLAARVPDIDLPDGNSDTGSFLTDLLLHGVAASKTGDTP